MRAVPDVALAAADHDGYFMVENGSHWIVSGTSAATPAFAGVMALIVDTMHGAAQGNVNPALYALANAASAPFHTTYAGSNGVPGVVGFAASGLAYNLATGLGSVDGALLVNRVGSGTRNKTNRASSSWLFPGGPSCGPLQTASARGHWPGAALACAKRERWRSLEECEGFLHLGRQRRALDRAT